MSQREKTYIRREGFVLRRVGEEAVLLPVEGGTAEDDVVYALNDVGAAIWQLIEPTRDAAEIGRRIAQEFDVTFERAAEDVDAFLKLLLDKGLLEEA